MNAESQPRYVAPNRGTAIFNATGGFTTMSVPSTATGSGEAAYAIDYNHSGLTSFLVLNGAVPLTGPVQLLTPTPT